MYFEWATTKVRKFRSPLEDSMGAGPHRSLTGNWNGSFEIVEEIHGTQWASLKQVASILLGNKLRKWKWPSSTNFRRELNSRKSHRAKINNKLSIQNQGKWEKSRKMCGGNLRVTSILLKITFLNFAKNGAVPLYL